MAFVGTEKTGEDVVFDAAFNEALNDGAPQDDEGNTPPADGEGANNLDGDTGDGAGDTPPADTPPADTPPADTPPADEPPAKTPEQLELEQVKADLAALRAAPPVVPPPPAPPKDEPKGPTPEETQAKADEDKAWADFKGDWPEVAAMMEKKHAATEAQLAHALAVVKQLTDQVTPLATAQAQSEDEKFVQTVLTTHKDASTLLPDVEKWILTLPRHQQVGANFVLDRGSAHDVVALYTEFKVATGRDTQHTPPPPEPPSGTTTPPAADKVDKLRKMESVSSRRTTHQEPPDSSDFDGAFDEAINSNKI